MTVLTGLALAAALTAPGAQAAVTTADLKAMHLEVVPCRSHNAAQEAADLALASDALEVMQKHDLPGVDKMMPDLRAAFNHAPDVAAAPELCGDKVTLYSDDSTAMLILSGAINSGTIPGAKTVEQHEGLPYGVLGFVIGWIEFEHKDYASAVNDYAKGLKNSPNLPSLESEYVLTLSLLGRNDDALLSIDGFVAANSGLSDHDHANLLRKRGYVLVELKRWDEAATAYKDSLKLEPDNDLAKSELDYIAKQSGAKS